MRSKFNISSVGAEAEQPTPPNTSQASGATNHARELSKKFTKHGFAFRQLCRTGNLATYEKTKGRWRGFEVIRIRAHKGYTIAGKFMEPAELYPTSEKWGVDGFSCSTDLDARIRMAKMTLLELKPTKSDCGAL